MGNTVKKYFKKELWDMIKKYINYLRYINDHPSYDGRDERCSGEINNEINSKK